MYLVKGGFLMSYRKEYIQEGELEFINKVVDAVVKKDVSKVHYLVDDHGLMRYVSFVKNKDKPIKDIVYDNGESAKVVCVFGEKLIEEIHNKAGDDDLTKPWIRRAVKSGLSNKVCKSLLLKVL